MTALPSRRRTFAALALCAVAYLYVFPYQPRINNPNENVRLYMTAALAEQGTYVIDDYRARWGWVNDCAVRDGHAYSVKAPASSFLGVVPYWLYLRWIDASGATFDRTVALWLCRVFASILPWLLFLFAFHRWLGRHTSSPLVRDAVFISLALGSCLYGYGLLFMSHTLSAAAAFGAFMLLHDAKHAGRLRVARSFFAGLLTAAVTLFEYPGFVASFLLTIYALVAVRPLLRLFPFALGGMIPTAAMMHFQWRCFGSPFSPGHLYVEDDFFRGRHEEGFFGAVGVQPEALYGLLVHPGAGLLPLTPILLAAVVGLYLLVRRERTRMDGVTVLGLFLLTLLGIAVMNNWRGGWTIGPRYLALVYPFLGWAALVGLEPAWRRWPRATAAFAVGATAVGLLLSGVPSAYYPHYPIPVDRPVTQIVAVLMAHGYAPYTAANLLGVYAGWSMIPLALLGLATLVWIIEATPERSVRITAAIGGLLVAIGLAYPLTIDPRPGHAEILEAQAFITRMWTPEGHDDAARLAASLAETPEPEGFERLAELLDAEGRANEARAARAHAARLAPRDEP
ncbi:MAG: hypothetical protein H6719_25915 [Sandaracinaceae bacterium]|nr:hypothetical protein [Sandaracinaceae bacterium]